MRLGHLAVLVDDVGDALRVFVLGGRGSAVGQPDLAIGIAEQREIEFELLGEAGVGRLVVEADPEDLGVFRRVLIVQVPEPGTFRRSAGCVSLRVEPKDHFAAAVLAELSGPAGVILDLEVWGSGTGLEHRSSSSERITQHSCQRHGDVL